MFPYVCKSGLFTITENKTILELVCLASGRAGKSRRPAGTKYFAYRVTCSARRGRARDRPVRRVFLPVPNERGSAGCEHCTGAPRQPCPHVPAARQGRRAAGRSAVPGWRGRLRLLQLREAPRPHARPVTSFTSQCGGLRRAGCRGGSRHRTSQRRSHAGSRQLGPPRGHRPVPPPAVRGRGLGPNRGSAPTGPARPARRQGGSGSAHSLLGD